MFNERYKTPEDENDDNPIRVIECDACGFQKDIDPEDSECTETVEKYGFNSVILKYANGDYYDLCPKCWKKLMKLLKLNQ